jgi:hypothetical protein
MARAAAQGYGGLISMAPVLELAREWSLRESNDA